MNRILILIFISALALLAGCRSKPDTPAAHIALLDAPEGEVVARVNGEEITAPVLEVFARGRGLDPDDPQQREQALDTLIETVLLAQDVYASGLGEKPEVRAEAALARLLQLSGRRMAAMRASIDVSEEELQRYYAQEAQRVGNTEFHLQHILFAEEDAALAAAGAALQPDADFEQLLGRYAAGGAVQARDLGWVNASQLPSELVEAVRSLPDGAVTPVPVRTEFGWHVLKRVGSRPFTPPPFEQVREGAQRQLVERAMADKVKALREGASIERPQMTQAPAG